MKKKLIETSLPIQEINAQASREKSIRHGHPSTMHLYWARRPLAQARAVLFGQLIDDPASRPEEFPTREEQDAERERLHGLLREFVVWKNSNSSELLESIREEIRKSNDGELPAVLDPFAGGGAIPLEAQRMGLEAHASDLNPVAVLINRALIELPARFSAATPVNPESRSQDVTASGTDAMAEDVAFYGQVLRDRAEERIGHLYPKVKVPGSHEADHTVIAWIWARTVKNPNPANPIDVPLVRSWWLSKKKGREAWVKPTVVDGNIRYEVVYDANGPKGKDDGTISRSGGGVSIADGTPMPFSYLREQSRTVGFGTDLIGIVAEGERGRIFVSPTTEHALIADCGSPDEVPTGNIFDWPGRINVYRYGLTEWRDLFTDRQLVALTTLADLVGEMVAVIEADAVAAGLADDSEALADGGAGARAYAEAIATYLALAVSRTADYSSNICTWISGGQTLRNVFGRQAIPMVWDYAESNPFSSSTGNYLGQVDWIVKALRETPGEPSGYARQADAATRSYEGLAVSTDPPYYDNIGYSDLSDFFYVWLRRMLRDIHPDIMGTMLTPKSDELVANPYRRGGKEKAEQFFVDGFNHVFAQIRENANTSVPLTVYYAYKQQDAKADGTASTGWHTLLSGLIDSGWEITATWPMRRELSNRMIANKTNALTSSIVLACRPRPENSPETSRRQLVAELRATLPERLRVLMQGSIAPVDLAQAAIGPGMAIYSRYGAVREADGTLVGIREALTIINQILDEVLNDQMTQFDAVTSFAMTWYKSYGWAPQVSGIADQLARSSGTSLGELQQSGIFTAVAGKAHLHEPDSFTEAWLPESDAHVSVWEAAVRLAGLMNTQGIDEVARLMPAVATRVSLESVKELAYLLFTEAEKRGSTADANTFNFLISGWVSAEQLAKNSAREIDVQDTLL